MNEILSQSIFFGIAITLVTYEIGLWIKQKTGKAIANPLLISVILIVAVLLLFHIDYETYANGAQYISIFLTPATVSLAVPLYRQLELLKTYPKAIFGGIIAGVLTAMVSVFALSLMFGLNHEQYVTLLPKSITTAIGMGISEKMGGIVTITVVVIIVTGIVPPLPQNAFLRISIPADAIIATTAGRRDFSTPCSRSRLRYFRYSLARIVTIMQDGRIHPTVATTAPGIPAIFSPTKVAEFTAMGPGVICDIVIRSVNSDMVSHP